MDILHRFPDLDVFALAPLFFDAFVYSFGCMALLFGKAFIGKVTDTGDKIKFTDNGNQLII
jgi:hypothetical protein